jgi:hypothetical protein
MILNAAVIFAVGWRRAIGAVIIGVLVIGWMSNRELARAAGTEPGRAL